jgi:hypothetical protein
VIDIGHSEASVTPVIDGFVLRKGSFFTHPEGTHSKLETAQGSYIRLYRR